MEEQFWKDRWAEGKIAFHEGKPNPMLEAHAARLAGARRVLVPLCGKAIDLVWLAERGHEVIGIEIVEDAARQFFAEHPGSPVTILVRDFFAVTREEVGAIDVVYDRAALIALPPEMRPRYADQLRVLAPGAAGLLISLEYDQAKMPGPPFSVEEPEVRALFREVELLETRAPQSPQLAEIGGSWKCYAVKMV